jgi:hypothetical protein
VKKEMIEALRLTREGRLSEAKALIERALGRGGGACARTWAQLCSRATTASCHVRSGPS